MTEGGKPNRTLAIFPVLFALSLLGVVLYSQLVYYPTFQTLSAALSRQTGIDVELVSKYEVTLTLLAFLALASMGLLAISVNAAFGVHLKGTRFLSQFKVFLLVLVALHAVDVVVRTTIMMLRARSGGPRFYWQPARYGYNLDTVSLIAVIAVTALAMSPASHHGRSRIMTSLMCALGAVLFAPTKVPFAYAVPVFLAASWVLVALWIWNGEISAPPPPGDIVGNST